MNRLAKFLLKISKSFLVGRIVQVARYTPFRGKLLSIFIHPDRGLIVGSGATAEDWEKMAKLDARYFISPEDWRTEQEFDAKGVRDLHDHLLSRLELDPRAKVLEIGCGIGRLLKPLSSLVAEVVGVDISPEMVRLARERLADLTNVQTSVTNGTLSSYTDETFDLVFSYAVFQHIPTKKAIIQYVEEAYRVLKPGGVFLCHVAEAGLRPKNEGGTWFGVSFSKTELRTLLETDFVDLRIEREVRDWMPKWCRNYLIGIGVKGSSPEGALVRIK